MSSLQILCGLLSLVLIGAAWVMWPGTFFAWKQRHRDWRGAVAGYALIVWLAAVAIFFGFSGGFSPANAHNHWINNGAYKGPDGTHCCGQNDCKVVPGSEMQPTASGWLIKSSGETIPYSEAQPSEDGEFWRCKRYDGSRRCFFAPPGST